jgi:hypothetical protein
MTTADIEQLVLEIARDSEELLTLAAGPDLPAGLKVLPLDVRRDAFGLSVGSGHDLALANGCQPGAVAVLVNIAGIVRMSLGIYRDRPDLGIYCARVVSEQIAAHETSHALVADLDGEHGVAEAVAAVQASCSGPIRCGADAHHPRWAAAYALLAARADRIRPVGQPGRGSLVSFELAAAYGIDAVAVADALGDVADEVPLRELLVPGGDAARRVAAVCLPEHERQVVIEQCRQRGAVGVGGLTH